MNLPDSALIDLAWLRGLRSFATGEPNPFGPAETADSFLGDMANTGLRSAMADAWERGYGSAQEYQMATGRMLA